MFHSVHYTLCFENCHPEAPYCMRFENVLYIVRRGFQGSISQSLSRRYSLQFHGRRRLSRWMHLRIDYDLEAYKNASSSAFGATLGLYW
ncbi:MAG: hypothetical protein FWE95_06655 [Planctomycetaceae bacterium]|nr:hypothetical protein [Planctomycetaceae bacterium]